MKFYAGRNVVIVTILMAITSTALCLGYIAFPEVVGADNPWIDYPLAGLLILITFSQIILAVKFWRFPTLSISDQKVHIPRFPIGTKSIPLNEVVQVRVSYLSLSPMIEIEYRKGDKKTSTVLAVAKSQQSDVLSQLSK